MPLPSSYHTQQDRPISGEHFVAVHVDQVGATEQLNPLLVGLSNMAISYLPVGYKLGSVVSATREVVRGVRYSLVVNVVTDTSEPLVCLIEVLEKPWILMQWGEKHRTLIHTNCTAEQYGAVAANEDKYSGFVNPVFVNNGVMGADELKNVEGQILPPKPTKKPVITSFEDLMKQILVFTTPKSKESTSSVLSTVSEIELTSTARTIQPDESTTPHVDEILPQKPLDDASKSLLDDFFNVDNNYRTHAESESQDITSTSVAQEAATIAKIENNINRPSPVTQETQQDDEVQKTEDVQTEKSSSPQIEGLAYPNSSREEIPFSSQSDSPRSKRQASSSEATLIESISRKALRQLDSLDADDFKRILLDVLRSNRKDLPKSTAHYVLALRVANSHCIETDDETEDVDKSHYDICSMNLVPGSTKICNVEVNSKAGT